MYSATYTPAQRISPLLAEGSSITQMFMPAGNELAGCLAQYPKIKQSLYYITCFQGENNKSKKKNTFLLYTLEFLKL